MYQKQFSLTNGRNARWFWNNQYETCCILIIDLKAIKLHFPLLLHCLRQQKQKKQYENVLENESNESLKISPKHHT